MSFSPLRPRRRFPTPYAFGFGPLHYSVVTFLSPISSLSKIPSDAASPPALPLSSTGQPPTINPDVAPSTSTGSQFSISSPEANQSQNTQELPPFSSFLSDVRPLLSRPNYLKLRPDHPVLGRRHRREYYTNHARRTKRPRFNQHLQYCLKPEFCKWEIILWDSKCQEYTIQSTSLPSQRLVVPHHRQSPHSPTDVA